MSRLSSCHWAPGGVLRTQRLVNRYQFEAVHRYGLSRANPLLILQVAPNCLGHPRFGFVVGKRVDKRAVVRNRVKRRLREALWRASVSDGWDVVVIARTRAAEARFPQLREALLDLLLRTRLLQPRIGAMGRNG